MSLLVSIICSWQFSTRNSVSENNHLGRRQYSLPHLQLVKGDKPSVCSRKRKEWTIHHIEDIRRYDAPGHTAYLKAFRRPCLGFSRRNKREPVAKSTEPPPARSVTSARYLNAYQAAELPQICEAGCSFLFAGTVQGAVPLQSKFLAFPT